MGGGYRLKISMIKMTHEMTRKTVDIYMEFYGQNRKKDLSGKQNTKVSCTYYLKQKIMHIHTFIFQVNNS